MDKQGLAWDHAGVEQSELKVAGYLDHFGLSVGYMLSFNFNQHKEPGMRRVAVGERALWEETI